MTLFLITILNIVAILIDVAWWIIVVQAILSWLMAFNVINNYNEVVRSVTHGLNVITEPVYRPIRRILPQTSGLDLSPLVVLIVILILRRAVLPALAQALVG